VPPTRKTPSKPRLVDLGEAAKILKVDPMKLFKVVSKGDVPGASKDGHTWRVDLEELQRFFDAHPLERK
jgi:hypothetical protein